MDLHVEESNDAFLIRDQATDNDDIVATVPKPGDMDGDEAARSRADKVASLLDEV